MKRLGKKKRKNRVDPISGYTHPEESEADDQMAALDFSSTFRKTCLSKALFVTNPLEKSMSDKHCESLMKEKKRKAAYLHHYQREFFINQIFKKGFNPYLNTDNPTSGKSNSKSASKRSHRSTESEAEKESYDRSVTSLPMLRSQTMGDLREKSHSSKVNSLATIGEGRTDGRTRKFTKVFPTELQVEKANSMGNLTDLKVQFADNFPEVRKKCKSNDDLDNDYNDSDGDNFSYADSEVDNKVNDKNAVGENKPKESEIRDGLSKQKPPGRLNRRSRDIVLLRKEPHLLFPKLNSLLDSYNPMSAQEISCRELITTANEEAEEELRKSRDSRRKSSKQTIGGVLNKKSEKEATIPKELEETKKEKKIKMIQNLTTHLPQELAETAKQQLRQMTNTDAIYQRKEKLRLQNLDILAHDHQKDPRWQSLENCLSDTHGMGKKWRKVYSEKLWMLY